MQIQIDSADPAEIREAYSWGIVSGVTTNPSLAGKTGRPYRDVVGEILEIIGEEDPISLEVTATDLDGMISQARELASWDDRVIVKLPCSWEGIKATKNLGQEGILVNMTLVFSVAQALAAAKAGAFYVSPFVGRLNDKRHGQGDATVEEIVTVYENYGFASNVLYASVRNVEAVEHAAKIGCAAVTVPFDVLKQMIQHPQTDSGLKKFLEDWDKAGLSLVE